MSLNIKVFQDKFKFLNISMESNSTEGE